MDRDFKLLIETCPIEVIKTCLPVGYTGFRWATMIEPMWSALLLANVLKIADQIEQKRTPVAEKRVFSYRFKYDEESGALFDRTVNWKAYYESASETSKKGKVVLSFDLADFYNKISHTKLHALLLQEIKADAEFVDKIIRMLSKIASENSLVGLPVGGNASRILAEAYLIPADNYMRDNGIEFFRFVDDYIIIADSVGDAYKILNNCAEYFLHKLGLSLQKNKTSIMSYTEFKNHVSSVRIEIEGDKNKQKESLLSEINKLVTKLHFDPYSATADDTLREIKAGITGSKIVKLLEYECKKNRINQMIGKQLIRIMQFLDENEISEAFEVIAANLEKLYPILPNILQTAYKLLPKCPIEILNKFTMKLSELFESGSYLLQTGNNASYALRILSLINNETSDRIIRKTYENSKTTNSNPSPLVRVNAIYAMTNLKNQPWLIDKLQSFSEATVWERHALVASSVIIGDVGIQWRKNFKGEFTSIESLIIKWVSEKIKDEQNWKLPL
jgi:hypothetical protein